MPGGCCFCATMCPCGGWTVCPWCLYSEHALNSCSQTDSFRICLACYLPIRLAGATPRYRPSRLSLPTSTQVLKKLRRLPWASSEPYLVRVLLKASKGRFSHIPLVASLAANLNRYHPSLGVAVVDALLEEVSLAPVQLQARTWPSQVPF